MSRYSRRTLLKFGTGLACSPILPAIGGFTAMAAPPAEPAAKPAAKPKVDPYADAVFVDGEPSMPAEGAFTVVVLPDTQKYAAADPQGFLAQTEWIAANRQSRNIACVLHLGDITDHNRPDEWELAVKAMQRLDGQVPYFLALGNHDYSEGGKCADRSTLFNDYFPIDKFRAQPNFGGVYDREPTRLENSYHFFSAGGRDFLVLCLEFGPRADVVRWANEIAAQHHDRAAILVTHAYMYYDETRYDWKARGKEQKWNPHSYPVAAATSDDIHDGEQLWTGLVARHENFILTLNGHVIGDGLARTVTATPGGRDVNQVLVNFQMKPRGGDGWLRVLEFSADGRTITACDYSPTRKQRNESPQNRFTMKTAPVQKA